MIRTILADHEALARQMLRQFLRQDPDVEVVGESATAGDTIELVRSTQSDLLFIDIRMPGMDGIDIANELNSFANLNLPRIVFTNIDDSYAVRAFEMHALDYVLKPYTAERLRSTLQRAHEQILARGENGHNEKRMRSDKRHSGRMVFKSRGRILFLPISDIRWIAAEENYVRICTGTGTHLLRETMTRVEERLDPSVFLRVHRSAIVNLHFVKEVRTNPPSTFSVIMVNGQRISMSRSYHSRIGELMARASGIDLGSDPAHFTSACA